MPVVAMLLRRHPSVNRRALPVLLLLILAFLAQRPCRAEAKLEIESCQWGFDDRAVPRAFNLLTVGIRNTSDEPFSGQLQVRRLLSAAGNWIDTELVEPLYIGPYTVRLFHLYPYVLDDSGEWELRWGPSLQESYVTELPPLSPGARVLFNDPQQVSGITRGLKGFREDYFPPNVVGTATLRIAVMDHLPVWEETRKNAFRDWLYRGGVLHVLHSNSGRFPELPVPELNVEPRPESFGSGRIYWHARRRSDLNRDFIYREIFPTARETVPLVNHSGATFDVDPTDEEFFKDPERFFSVSTEWNTDELIPRRLKELVRPRHEWPLIYVLSGAYILMIFPGGLLLSRTKLDYRLSLLALLLVVGLFSGLFSVIGARGYGDTAASTVSAALIRPLPGNRWDVEQWSSLFVTAGGRYEITHDSDYLAYSTAQDNEKVSGWIDNGRGGRFSMDMPPFTFRAVLSRQQMQAPGVALRLLPAATGSGIELELNGPLPSRVDRAWLLTPGGRLSASIVKDMEPPESLIRFQFHDAPETLSHAFPLGFRFRNFVGQEAVTMTAGLARFDDWLMTRDLGIRRGTDPFLVYLPPDRVRVYLGGELPEQLAGRTPDAVTDEAAPAQGRALYCFDLPLPDTVVLPVVEQDQP